VGFLTGPRAGDALEIVRDYLVDQHAALGLEKADVADWVLTDRVLTRHNGLTHLYFRQRLAGIEVRHGELAVSVSRDGRLIGLRSRFVPGLARAVNARAPVLGAAQAVQAAAGHLGLAPTGPLTTLETRGGPAREVLLGDGGISLDPIPVKLMYLADGEGAARLVWDLDIRPPGGRHWWHLGIDALDGAVLLQVDRIVNDSYRVFALPKEDPDAGPRSDESNPADATASPFGWHDTNGAVGAEHTDTRGNNVNAQDDVDANNSGGFRPSGGAGLDFLFAHYPAQPPSSSLSAAITNLFYWNNVLHDVHYRYGFDEVSGNFQATNRGLGGAGGDPVQADAQDGSAFNNANFSLAVPLPGCEAEPPVQHRPVDRWGDGGVRAGAHRGRNHARRGPGPGRHRQCHRRL
jgi:extracellular elastinolytic metalloproteinase